MLFDGLLRRNAVATFGGAQIGHGGERGKVSYDGCDGVETIPAGHGRAEITIVEHDLCYAHEHFAVEFAVVGPHGHLKHTVLIVRVKFERLLKRGT